MALSVIDQQKRMGVSVGRGKRSGEWRYPLQRHQLAGDLGFSMIEMMVALLILTVSILGMTTLTLTSIQANHQNDLRNTAIKVTSETAEILLAQPIDNIISGGLTPYDATNLAINNPNYRIYPNPIQPIKGGTQPYTVTWVATSLTNDLTQINITVTYTYKGQQHTNNAVIYKHRVI